MNHFLAFSLDSATRDRLGAIAERLRAWDLPAAWIHPDDYHITIRFLGALDDDEVQLLPTLIDDVAGSIRRPSLRLVGLGATGTRGHGLAAVPRGIFAAVADDDHACAGLHRDVGDCLDEQPLSDFLPHVTLCRPHPQAAQGQLFRDWPHVLEAHGVADWGTCTVESLVFYRSGEFTPRYETLTSWAVH